MNPQTPIDGQSEPIKKRKRRYWVWILVGFVAFVLVISWMNRASLAVEIQQSRFGNMVAQRAIKKIVLVDNEKIVEITLRPEALRNAVYKMELERANSPFEIDPNGPHYQMRIASVDKFYRDYEEVTASMSREDIVDVQVEERNDITGMLINWMFLGMIIFGIVRLSMFFSRR